MQLLPITTLDDERVAPYRDVKDRNLAADGGLFMAEGEYLVQRLLQSAIPTVSVLISERRLRNRQKPLDAPDHVPVYVAPEPLLTQITGVQFHGGILAVGRRPPSAPLGGLFIGPDPRHTLVICPEISNPTNLGAILRSAAAFGASGLILGPSCCDPWYRKSVRTSMGAVFTVPIVQSTNLQDDLQRLAHEHHVELTATVVDHDAAVLAATDRPARIGLIMGNEEFGVTPRLARLCHRRVTIPMHTAVDSLNVVVATGIMLHHYTHIAPMRRSGPIAVPGKKLG